jgi:hypothetical protein
MLYKPDRPSLADVAHKIGGVGGDWLIPGLDYFTQFIKARDEGDDLELRLLTAAQYLEIGLSMYGHLEDHGFECPDFISDLSDNLSEFIEWLLKARLEHPKGGRPIDWPKRICALVVIEAWRLCRSREPEPRSRDVLETCGDYWLACGGEWTDKIYEDEYWQRAVEWARSADGDWVRERLLRAKPTPK